MCYELKATPGGARIAGGAFEVMKPIPARRLLES
jgi:hypothetical protein